MNAKWVTGPSGRVAGVDEAGVASLPLLDALDLEAALVTPAKMPPFGLLSPAAGDAAPTSHGVQYGLSEALPMVSGSSRESCCGSRARMMRHSIMFPSDSSAMLSSSS